MAHTLKVGLRWRAVGPPLQFRTRICFAFNLEPENASDGGVPGSELAQRPALVYCR